MLPIIFEIRKIENKIYAIGGITRCEGAEFRNFWIVDFNSPKAKLKSAVVSCTTDQYSCNEMTMKADTIKNELNLYLRVGFNLKRHLVKDSTLYVNSPRDPEKDNAFILNNYHYLLVNGKEPAWEEANLYKETGKYIHDFLFLDIWRSQSCEPQPIKIKLKY